MTTMSQRSYWLTAGSLAAIMAVTRIGHFGEAGGLPDASWAVFFLGGLWLRDSRLFPGFFALGWVADMIAFSLGTPTNCYSIAYLFLIPAYGSLWMAGRLASERLPQQVAAVVLGAASAFFFANLGMLWLAPSAQGLSTMQFASAVAGYFPGYLLTMSVYVAVGLLAAQLLGKLRPSLRASE
ncbi:MAG: hypothetical protein RLZZ473_225 [Pseudomonadota bacterium]|jgi:hypothetical protein